MTGDRSNGTADDRPSAPGTGSPARDRLYDAFVVRLWRDAGSGRIQRAEVEHVESGMVARAAGVSAGWVLTQIRARLGSRPAEEERRRLSEGTGPPGSG
jgi:hypothetical protein